MKRRKFTAIPDTSGHGIWRIDAFAGSLWYHFLKIIRRRDCVGKPAMEDIRMNYVIANLHGDYDRYQKMLGKIALKEDDTLYVLGNVLDPEALDGGMKLFQDMAMRPNVIPIIGRNEFLASITLGDHTAPKEQAKLKKILSQLGDAEQAELISWIKGGGNAVTREFRELGPEDQEDFLDYLSEFSLVEEVRTEERTFLLVSAGLDHFSPDRDPEDYRPWEVIYHPLDFSRKYLPDRCLVSSINPEPHADRIVMKNRNIAIDCGARLGCLCLDTMKPSYI